MKVSVVIPCYNVEEYVKDTVTSAIGQTYPVENIICVDDGSTDDTFQVLQDLKSEYPKQLTIRSEKNRGGNHARNVGLKIAKSKYIQFLDADDILDSDKIEHQVKLIQDAGMTIDLVAAAYRKGETPEQSDVREPGCRSDIANLAGSSLGRTSSNLWRASAVRSVGGWNESWDSSQEYELMFRLLKNGSKICYDRSPKTWMRKRSESITGKKNINVPRRILDLRLKILNHVKKKEYKKKELKSVEKSLFYWVKHMAEESTTEAISYYKKAKISIYSPSPKKYGYIYVTVLKFFGFGVAERLRKIYNYIKNYYA